MSGSVAVAVRIEAGPAPADCAERAAGVARTAARAERQRLSDVGNRVARRYGLVFALSEAARPLYTAVGSDLPAYNGDALWELPVPGTFVMAPDGTVRLAFVDPDYTHRLEPAAILAALRALAPGH